MLDFYRSIPPDQDWAKDVSNSLRRIAEALERLSPPLPNLVNHPDPPFRQTHENEIVFNTPDRFDDISHIKKQFAIATDTVVDTQAFWEAMYQAEEYVAHTEGEEAVDLLEWNKHGRLFNRERYHKAKIERERKERDSKVTPITKKNKDGAGEQESAPQPEGAA